MPTAANAHLTEVCAEFNIASDIYILYYELELPTYRVVLMWRCLLSLLATKF